MEFRIKNKVLRLVPNSIPDKIVGDNTDYKAKFYFDEEWDGLVKTIRFINNGVYCDQLLDENDECKIPIEVLKGGQLYVGAFSGDIHTTSGDNVIVTPSILERYGEPAIKPEEIYTQVIEREIPDAINNYFEKNPVPTVLPIVSEEDNGKILRVVDGMWTATTILNAEGVGF